MPNLPQAAFLEALGWTLLNSWWQFGILWVLFLFLKKVLPRQSAANRYNISLLLLVSGMVWTFISFLLRWNSLLENGYQFVRFTDNRLYYYYLQSGFWIRLILPYLSVTYLIWLGVRLIRFSRLFLITRRVKMGGLQKAPVSWRIFLEKMSGHMNICSKVQIWLSDKIDTPLILGWLKPVILLPFSAVNQLSTDQLEAILIHELAHIKRNDYFWNLVVALAEVIFYYNPFARYLVEAIREEREHSCDDWVLQFPFRPEQYANALLKLEQQRTINHSELLLAARGSSRNVLLVRVQRMLKMPVSSHESPCKMAILAGIVGILAIAGMVEPREEIKEFFKEVITNPLVSRESNNTVAMVEYVPEKPVTLKLKPQAKPIVKQSPDHSNTTSTPLQVDEVAGSEPEQDAEWVANADLILSQGPAVSNQAVTMGTIDENIYTLPQQINELTREVHTGDQPYVPSSSFQSLDQQVKDTSIPATAVTARKAKIISQKAKEAAIQTQLAMEQIDWIKLRQKLITKGATPETIQFELEKALAEVDWDKIQKDAGKVLRNIEKLNIVNNINTTIELKEACQVQKAELDELNRQLEYQEKATRKAIQTQSQELQMKHQKLAKKRTIVYL
jgi:beta-lactamase regulating signal transducer with metallopeptidase domain